RWADADHDPQAALRSFAVLLDPDLVTPDDVIASAAGDPVRTILAQRAADLATYADELDTLRQAASSPQEAFEQLVGSALPGVDLEALRKALDEGQEITGQLEAIGLSRGAFLVLGNVRALAAAGPVTTDEWRDVDEILVGAEKRRRVPQWRGEETGLTL